MLEMLQLAVTQIYSECSSSKQGQQYADFHSSKFNLKLELNYAINKRHNLGWFINASLI